MNVSSLTAGLVAIVESADKAHLKNIVKEGRAISKQRRQVLRHVYSLLTNQVPAANKFSDLQELANHLGVPKKHALNTLIGFCNWRSVILDIPEYRYFETRLSEETQRTLTSKSVVFKGESSSRAEFRRFTMQQTTEEVREKLIAAAHFDLSRRLLETPIPRPVFVSPNGDVDLPEYPNPFDSKVKAYLGKADLIAGIEEGFQRLIIESNRLKLLGSMIDRMHESFTPGHSSEELKAIRHEIKECLTEFSTIHEPSDNSTLSFLHKFDRSLQSALFVTEHSLCYDLSHRITRRNEHRVLQPGGGALLANPQTNYSGLQILGNTEGQKSIPKISDISTFSRLPNNFVMPPHNNPLKLHVGLKYPTVEVDTASVLPGRPNMKVVTLAGLNDFNPDENLAIQSKDGRDQLTLKPKLIVLHEGTTADTGQYSTWIKTPAGDWHRKGSRDDRYSSAEMALATGPNQGFRPVFITYESVSFQSKDAFGSALRPSLRDNSILRRSFRKKSPQ